MAAASELGSCRAQVHFIWPNGQGALLAGVEKLRPSYERLLSLLRSVPGSKASRSWVDRVNPFTRVYHRIPAMILSFWERSACERLRAECS